MNEIHPRGSTNSVYLHRNFSMNQFHRYIENFPQTACHAGRPGPLQDVVRYVRISNIQYPPLQEITAMEPEDTGMLVSCGKGNKEANHLELKFCVSGNVPPRKNWKM